LGSSWRKLRVCDCLVERHKTTALYSSSGNTAVHHISERFCYSNSKKMQNLRRSMKLFLKEKIHMVSGFTACFSELWGRYVELIILIDWLIDYWSMGNSTANTGCGTEQFIQVFTNHGSFYHAVFEQWDCRQAKLSGFFVVFLSLPSFRTLF